MRKTCKICLIEKDYVNDFFQKVNVCKSCKNIQQRLRNNKMPLPESMQVKKVEFNCICSVCENQRPLDWYQKKSFVCKICIAERQHFYSRKLPLPDRLKSKNVHKVLNTNHLHPERVDIELQPLTACTTFKRYENNGLILLLEFSKSGNLMSTKSI
jgi:hypothetical protein